MQIRGVEIPDIPAIWPYALPLIRRATEQTGEDAQKIGEALIVGKAQMVIAHDAKGLAAVLITELPVIKGKLVCNVRILAGRDMDFWFGELDGLEQWAREKGCASIRCTDSRVGWKRMLSRNGYKPIRVTLEKEL